MDEQHQNFEYSEGFGFINAFSGTDNFLNQQQEEHINSKALNEPSHQTLTPINPAFDSRSIETYPPNPPEIYDIPPHLNSTPHYTEPSMQYASIGSNINGLSEKPTNSFNIQSDPIIDTEVNQQSENASDDCNKTKEPEASTSTFNDKEKQDIESDAPSQDVINFSHSQNTVMKALGVVRKEVLGASANKKRRRIVMLNDDDSDDDCEMKKDVANKSDENVEEKDSEHESKSEEAKNEESENEESNPDALKVKTLLKSAVIIHDPDDRKKKKQRQRVLDSDEEDHMQTSVDDIGMINEDDMNEDEALVDNIIISEPTIPIIEESEIPETETNANETTEEVVKSPKQQQSPEATTKEPEEDNPKSNKNESEEKSLQENEDAEEIDPSMSVEAILENIKPMADDE
jgi:hypothetical protein